jgi:hypothetical protein
MARVWRVALAIVLMVAGPARADLLIVERTQGTVVGRPVEGMRSTYIKGARMRVEIVQGDRSSVTLFDLPAGTVANLDAKKQRAELHDIAARHAKLEKESPRRQVAVTLEASGATRTIADASCDAYTFLVRVPVTRNGDIAVTLTGTACLAESAPGADDYHAFARTAVERELAIGYVSDNAILLAGTRAQTELYRALSGKTGVPYLIDMKIDVEGHGMAAGIVRKGLAGTRTSTVTSVATAPLAEALFSVPGGWKREKK